jgi:hypothetical protein
MRTPESEKLRLAAWYARNRKNDPVWRETNRRRAFLWREANLPHVRAYSAAWRARRQGDRNPGPAGASLS